MILYHGSNLDIPIIDLKASMKGKDFGQGFYLSESKEQAMHIATIRSIALKAKPVVNVYEIDDAILENGSLNIRRLDGYTREWAEFVLANRRNSSDTPIHNYDIVIGPIANDRVGQQIRKFTDGEITMEVFIERLKYMKGLTIQYFFGTEKSIQHLKKLPSII